MDLLSLLDGFALPFPTVTALGRAADHSYKVKVGRALETDWEVRTAQPTIISHCCVELVQI